MVAGTVLVSMAASMVAVGTTDNRMFDRSVLFLRRSQRPRVFFGANLAALTERRYLHSVGRVRTECHCDPHAR